MPSEKRDPLGRTDFVAYWADEARAHATSFGWDAARIPAVVETLEEAFGAEWLREGTSARSQYPLTGDPKKHPVVRMLATPDRTSAMKLVEVAVYLRSCAALPHYKDVVHLLRIPRQFSTALMQLALAHRLVLAGATDVELEPAAANGRKADLFFRYGGRSHLAECYEPTNVVDPDYRDLIHSGVERVMNVVREVKRRVIVHVDIRGAPSSLDVATRKQIEHTAGRLIRRLSNTREHLFEHSDAFDIEVIDTSGVDSGDVKAMAFKLGKPDAWIVAPALARRSNLAEIPRGGDVRMTHLAWFVINAAPRAPADEMRRLVDTLEEKVPQVRRAGGGVLGLMVAITGFARAAAVRNPVALPLVESLRAKVLAVHDGLAGAFLLASGIHHERGPFLGGLYLEGREGAHLDGLHAAIALREERRRVIDDWT